jgi:hypothetical protein
MIIHYYQIKSHLMRFVYGMNTKIQVMFLLHLKEGLYLMLNRNLELGEPLFQEIKAMH